MRLHTASYVKLHYTVKRKISVLCGIFDLCGYRVDSVRVDGSESERQVRIEFAGNEPAYMFHYDDLDAVVRSVRGNYEERKSNSLDLQRG